MTTVAPTPTVAGEAITLSGVSKSYVTAKGRLPVLEDIDLDIRAGEFVSLVGPSGCGKSTLLKIIAGLVGYDEGTVTVGDRAPREGRDDIGFMLQQSVLMPHFLMVADWSKNFILGFAGQWLPAAPITPPSGIGGLLPSQ